MSQPEERPSAFFLAWGKFVVRHRWLLLLLTLLTSGVSAYFAATRTTIDMGVEAFSSTKSRSSAVLKEFRDEFGRDDVWVVVIEGDVFSVPYLDRLRTLHDRLAAIDLKLDSLGERRRSEQALEEKAKEAGDSDGFGDDFDGFGDADDEGWGDEEAGGLFEDVISLINTKETRGSPDGIEVADLFPETPAPAALPAIKTRILADPAIVGQIVGLEGRHSLIIMRSAFMSDDDSNIVTQEVRRIAAELATEAFVPHVAGLPALNADITGMTMSNMQRLFGAATVLMLLTLLYLFRHPLGIGTPMLVVAFASLNTFGAMAVFGIPMTMLSMILPAFIVCVGMGDSVHLISVYRDARGRGMEAKAAAAYAVGTTGKPVFYTSVTTMIGLFSFRFASIEGIQQMGTAGGFGVAAACLHSLVLLPIALTFVRNGTMGAREEGNDDRLDHFLRRCNAASGLPDDDGHGPEPGLARQRRRRTLFLGIGLIVALVAAMSLIRVYHNPMAWIASEHRLSVAFDVMDEHMGGNANIHLLVDGPEGKGLKDLELLRGLEALEKHMAKFDHPEHGKIVGPTLSVLSVVKSTQRALNGGKLDQYRLPDTDRGVSDSFFLFENAGPEQLSRLATNDLSRGRVSFRLKWIEANGYAPVAEHLESGIEKLIPAGAKVQPTGTAYTLLSTIGGLIGDLGRSFGFACIVITFLLMLQLRSVKMGLIAMVPNLVPIIFVMGFMGLTGIPIDLANILIASIAIGIAVDDTIHLLHHFRVHFDQYGNVEEAIRNAFEHAGRAMVSTTVILTIGFAAFSFATVSNIQRFGTLIALTAVTAMFIDLVFTPALLRTFYGRKTADVEAGS